MYKLPDPKSVSPKERETVSNYINAWYDLTYGTVAKRNAILYLKEFLLTHIIECQACVDSYDEIVQELIQDSPELIKEYQELLKSQKDVTRVRQEYCKSTVQDPKIESVYALQVAKHKQGREHHFDLMIADREMSAQLDVRWRSFLERVKQQEGISEILKKTRQKITTGTILLTQLQKASKDWRPSDE